MTTQKSNNLYVGVCIAQSIAIVALAFYIGSLRTQSEEQKKDDLQKWTNDFLDLTTFEISIPVLRDYSLAPAGKTGIIVSRKFSGKFDSKKS